MEKLACTSATPVTGEESKRAAANIMQTRREKVLLTAPELLCRRAQPINVRRRWLRRFNMSTDRKNSGNFLSTAISICESQVKIGKPSGSCERCSRFQPNPQFPIESCCLIHLMITECSSWEVSSCHSQSSVEKGGMTREHSCCEGSLTRSKRHGHSVSCLDRPDLVQRF